MCDKYLIFLPDGFKRKKGQCLPFKGYKFTIVDDLMDKGVTVKFKEDIQDIVNANLEGDSSLTVSSYSSVPEIKTYTFDDEIYPRLNTLYIHLFNGDYYSDSKYRKQKLERERSMLFLLAAKLGVSSITYDTDIFETTLSKVDVSVNIKTFSNTASFSKSITQSKGQSGKEVYNNRGAPIYTLSRNIYQVEDNIKKKFGSLNSKLFSYDFYENNPSLKAFVYKRFNFKMSNMEYVSETENNFEIGFNVNTTLMDYGIGINFEKQTMTTEKITYQLDFYGNKELRLALNDIIKLEEDTFGIIREIYDAEDNKEIGIYHITEYVRRYSRICKLTYIKKKITIERYVPIENQSEEHTNTFDVDITIDEKVNTSYIDTEDSTIEEISAAKSMSIEKVEDEIIETITETYYKRLNNWIKANGQKKFKEECKNFNSSYQIRTWFKDELVAEDEELIDDEDEIQDDIEGYGILKLKKDNFQQFIDSVIQNEDFKLGKATQKAYASQATPPTCMRRSSIRRNRLRAANGELIPNTKAREKIYPIEETHQVFPEKEIVQLKKEYATMASAPPPVREEIVESYETTSAPPTEPPSPRAIKIEHEPIEERIVTKSYAVMAAHDEVKPEEAIVTYQEVEEKAYKNGDVEMTIIPSNDNFNKTSENQESNQNQNPKENFDELDQLLRDLSYSESSDSE